MKEEYQTRSQESNLTKYLAEHESMNNGRSFFGCVFHFFDTSYHPTTKDEIIINLRKKRWTSYDAETNTGGVHWWTFLGAYNDLGDCTFAQVVRIRDKKTRGKTLEKDEREWYRRNSDLVNIKNKLSQEEETTISTWLKLGKE